MNKKGKENCVRTLQIPLVFASAVATKAQTGIGTKATCEPLAQQGNSRACKPAVPVSHFAFLLLEGEVGGEREGEGAWTWVPRYLQTHSLRSSMQMSNTNEDTPRNNIRFRLDSGSSGFELFGWIWFMQAQDKLDCRTDGITAVHAQLGLAFWGC